MGVHITFVRSTNLDAWSHAQLRAMKVGGNAAFSTFLHKHGAGSLQGKAKYEGRVGELYKEELGKRIKEDEGRWPAGVVVEGSGIGGASGKEVADGKDGDKDGEGEEDFFESWSKPSTPRGGTPVVGGGVPVLGRAASVASTTSTASATTTSTTNGSSGPATTVVAPRPRMGLASASTKGLSSGGALKLGGGSKKGKLGE